MTSRSFLSVLACAAACALPFTAQAQLNPGVHLAHATKSFDGVNGVGGSLQLTLPLLPIDFQVAGEYFFPGCDDCSLWGGSADVHFAFPTPILRPYGAAGVVMRRAETPESEVRAGGIGLGAGLNLSALVMGAYAEGRYEFMDGGDNQFVFRLGVRF